MNPNPGFPMQAMQACFVVIGDGFVGLITVAVSKIFCFFFSSRRRHTRSDRDWSSDVCSSDLPFAYDTCVGSNVAPVMKLDAAGNVLKSFGAGMFVFPHKVYVDRDGNVWVVDQRGVNERERLGNPQDAGKGHTVVKFSPEGKVLLTLGKAGVRGNPPDALTEPTSVLVASDGRIVVSEGHSGQAPAAPADTVARISIFTPDGSFIRSF